MQQQEVVRKDVEGSFGVLQAQWIMVKGPTHLFYQYFITDIMYVNIIMHNIIDANKGAGVTDWADEDAARSSHGMCSEHVLQGVPHGVSQRLRAFITTHQEQAHHLTPERYDGID